MRTTQEIQAEANSVTAELGSLRGQYLHHERQLSARLYALDVEMSQAMKHEQKLAPQALHERLAALEAATTKGND